MNNTIIISKSQENAMFDSCPSELKETILRLLATDRFVEAKALFDQWRQQAS